MGYGRLSCLLLLRLSMLLLRPRVCGLHSRLLLGSNISAAGGLQYARKCMHDMLSSLGHRRKVLHHPASRGCLPSFFCAICATRLLRASLLLRSNARAETRSQDQGTTVDCRYYGRSCPPDDVS